jgi:DNA-binding NtrC family response regulator
LRVATGSRTLDGMEGAAPSSARSISDGPGEDEGSSAPRARVLVVDDEAAVLRALRRSLEGHGFEVLAAQSAGEALGVLASAPVDVVLSDACMPAMTGTELLERIRQAGLACEVVIMSAYTDAASTLEALRGGAAGFIGKPFPSLEHLVFELERAAELKRLRHATRAAVPQDATDELVGTSSRAAEVFRRIGDVALLPSPLVVQGERGTGKRVIASAVHRRSRRKGELLVVEARGASTSFARLAAQAAGGTLCVTRVDEADEVSRRRLVDQVKDELRARVVLIVQDAKIASDVAACFPRASTLNLPALRDRERDALLLASYFVGRHVRRSGKATELTLDPSALDAISRYTWPGNVAELEAAIAEAISLSPSGRIDAGALPPAVRGEVPRPDLSAAPVATPPRPDHESFTALPYAEAKQRAVAAFTRAYVLGLLTECDGDVPRAAAAARLEPSSLRRLLRRARVED